MGVACEVFERNDLGSRLRALRLRRLKSIRQIATEAGIGRSTLSRWERGEVRPDLAELESILTALKATEDETVACRSIVCMPSLDAQLREQTSRRFLRAIRVRGRLTLAESAKRAGVSKGTFSRWESGDRVPDQNVLVRTAKHLGATECELHTLKTGLLLHEFSSASVNQLRDRVGQLRNLIPSGLSEPLDLPFIAIDQVLRHYEQPEARRLRLEARAAYIEWLGWWYRETEATRYADATLPAITRFPDLPVWGRIVRTRANYLTEIEDDPEQATTLICDALRVLKGMPSEGFLRRELAGRLASLGQHKRALDELSRAEDCRNEEDLPKTHLFCCQMIRSATFSSAGYHDAAIASLPWESASDPYLRFSSTVQFARTFWNAGLTVEARQRIEGAYEEAQRRGFRHFAVGLRQRLVSPTLEMTRNY